jgi:single-stranded-DNA-specific exonuclease
MSDAFLGVTESFKGQRWAVRSYDERTALALSQRLDLPDVIAKSLTSRGIDLDSAESFLEPRLRDQLPNPSLFLDMDKGASRFADAITRKEKIAVFGDYDVDGATSSALLLRFARSLGADPQLYIPDRIKEGYGPNAKAMEKLAADGARLVVCVDCGVTAHEPLKAAKEAGLDVIVIDHHAAEPVLPPATAVINPNRLDETNTESFGTLAAVGVTYLFAIAVNRHLRQNGFYANRAEPDLLALLDLVALGTVCDVVKLTGLNRTYVSQGLKIMGQRQNIGIAALLEAAKVVETSAYTAGFILGPRINAGGRVGKSDMGVRLLSCDDPTLAKEMATELCRTNDERRAIEAEVLIEAERTMFDDASPLCFVAANNWHPGVIGIVASRLKERFHRPAIVIAVENGIGKGSGRSIGNIDLGAAVIAARQAGLLINGGGHRMAAGLTVAEDKIADLRSFLSERIGKQLMAEPFDPVLSIDGLATVNAFTEGFMENLSRLAPFGTGNPEPRFALANCKLIRASVVGEKHVSLIVSQGSAKMRGIAFRAMECDLGPALLSLAGKTVHLAGHIRTDDWKNDGSVQILVDDAAQAHEI